MDVAHREDGKGGEFTIKEGSDVVAELKYSREGEKLTIEHTRVDEKLRGRGVGHQLVEAAVDFAREKKLRVHPVCTYARSVFDKNAKYEDVRA
jgi:predicted GNAT family acetyltransferase